MGFMHPLAEKYAIQSRAASRLGEQRQKGLIFLSLSLSLSLSLPSSISLSLSLSHQKEEMKVELTKDWKNKRGADLIDRPCSGTK